MAVTIKQPEPSKGVFGSVAGKALMGLATGGASGALQGAAAGTPAGGLLGAGDAFGAMKRRLAGPEAPSIDQGGKFGSSRMMPGV